MTTKQRRELEQEFYQLLNQIHAEANYRRMKGLVTQWPKLETQTRRLTTITRRLQGK